MPRSLLLVSLVALAIQLCVEGGAVEVKRKEKRFGSSNLKISETDEEKTPRIIGGFDAPRGRYPYYTGLWITRERVLNCGASLIAPDVVLTAAHCLSEPDIEYTAQVGRYNLENPKDAFEAFQILKYLPYPYYGVEAAYSGDFMLLFLNGNSSTPPLKINHQHNVPHENQNVTVIGLGDTDAGFGEASVLQVVTLNAITNKMCERATDGLDSNKGRISADSLCLWSIEKSYCYGDSGGPLFIEGDSPEEDVQVGIVSWSHYCYDPNFPDVSARVSEAAEWIDSNVCRHSRDPPAWFNCQNRTFPPDLPLPTNPVLPGQTYPITVEIDFEYASYESWWFILNSTGHLVYITPRYTYAGNYTLEKVEQVVHLPIGQTYTFVVKDGEGGYEVRLGTNSDGEILVPHSFSREYDNRTQFTLSSSLTSPPTQSPTLSKAPSISPAPTLPVRAVTVIINFAYEFQAAYFGYEFLNSLGSVVNSAPIGSFGYYNISVVNTVHLPKDENYTFVFMSQGYDLYPGNYTLMLGTPEAGGPVLAIGNGTFDDDSLITKEDRTIFFLPNSFTAAPSVAPSRYPSLTPTVTPRPTAPLQALTLTIDFAYHDPYNFGYVILNSRNKTIFNETAGTFDDFNETDQRVLHVPSDEQYTFELLNQFGYQLFPGNYTIAVGLPGDRGPILAPNNDFFSNDESITSTVVTTATFYVPSTFTSYPSMAPTPTSPVTLFIDFAGYPSEVGFAFLNTIQEPIVDVPIGTFGFANKTFEQTFNFPPGLEYTFVISDFFGDGGFPGKFSLIMGTPGSGGKTIVSKSGIQGLHEEFKFTLAQGAPAAPSLVRPKPTPVPVASSAPSTASTPVSSGAVRRHLWLLRDWSLMAH